MSDGFITELLGLRIALAQRPQHWPLQPCEGPADVVVEFGEIGPATGEIAFRHGVGGDHLVVWRDEVGWCWCWPDDARFRINAAATHVLADIPDNYDLTDMATYLVGPILAFLLRRRGITCLHATTVRIGATTWALCGKAGAGKSSLAAALVARGATLISEDLTPLRLRDGGVWVPAGTPMIRLWPDSAARYGDLPQITPNWEKRFIATPTESSTLNALVLLEGGDSLEPLSLRETAVALIDNVYGSYSLDAAQRGVDLDLLTTVTARIRGYRLGRTTLHAIDEMCEALETADA